MKMSAQPTKLSAIQNKFDETLNHAKNNVALLKVVVSTLQIVNYCLFDFNNPNHFHQNLGRFDGAVKF